MKLGLNQICLDERPVPLLGSQDIDKKKSGSCRELKNQ